MVTRRMMIGMIVVGLLWMGTTVWGVHYYVDPNGDNSDGLTWAKAFHTIQQGIDANNPTIVEVNEVTYYESIDFNGVACMVASTDPNDPNVVAATIIDANGGTRAVYFHNSEGVNSVLRGFTVTGGGTGVYCDETSPTISNCVMEDNTYFGAYCYLGGPAINNCTIKTHNYYGVFCSSSNATIESCIIEDNGYYGIYAHGGTVPAIRYNEIRENDYDGIYLSSSSASVKSNWVYDNGRYGIRSHNSGSAVLRNNTLVANTNAGIYVYLGTEPTVTNCIIWDCNDDLYDCNATYSCIQDGDSSTGNISSYPYFADYNNRDLHLTWNSPCINRGDPNGSYTGETDIDGETRVAGEEFVDERVDMGADEMNVHNIELVKNPGFEDGNDAGGTPLNWTTWDVDHHEVDSNEKHSGTFSWKFSSDDLNHWDMGKSDPIAVEYGQTYRLSGWIKCSVGMERNDLTWEEYDVNSNSLWLYSFKGNTPGLADWTEYGALRATEHEDVNHIKVRFLGPTKRTGAVWWDDFSVTEQVEFLPPYGRANTNDVKTIDFGAADDNDPNYHGGIIWNSSSMGSRKTDSDDENNNHREIEGYSSLTSGHPLRLEIPAFNVDANGFPLTPMLLEIMYKDTVPATESVVFSKIDYIDLDPNYLRDPNRHYAIAHLGDCNDSRWKYMQYAFQESDYQLLRAIDDNNDGNKEFVIEITASKVGLLIPVDYISLRKITQTECEQLTGKQRAMRGFFEAELPSDAPSPAATYDDPNLVVFSRDIMRPVYKHTKPGPNEPNDANGFGCWGETEALSFSIYSENGVNDLTLTVSNLTYANDSNYSIDGNDILMSEVVYDEKRLEDYLVKSFGLLPDRLEEFASLSVDPCSSKRIWLNIRVPDEDEGLPGGVYEGQVTIQRTADPNVIVPIDFKVYDITLDGPGFTNPVLYDPYVMSQFNNIAGVFEAYVEVGVDPFISSEPHLIQVGKDPNDANDPIKPDKVVFDTNNFEVVLGRMINEGFAKDTAVIWMHEWYFRDLYDLVMEPDYGTIKNDPNLYFYLSDANFAEALGTLVEKYVEIGDSCGIEFAFFVADEPSSNPYRRIISDRLLSVIKDPNYVEPDYDVKTAATYYSICDELLYLDPNNGDGKNPNKYKLPDELDCNLPGLTELVDYKIWPMGTEGTGYSKHQDPNYTGFFGYYTTHHATTRNPVYNRFLHGLFAFRTDATAIWLWAMGSFNNDPFNDFDAGYRYILPFTYPDFIFAYPTWSGELLYTVGGLEGIREGIKDAKYIATLERLIEEDPEDPNAPDANAYLADVNSRIESDFRYAYHYKTTQLGYHQEILADINDSNDPNDFEAFTRIRKTIADHIVACSTHYYGVHNTTQDKWYYSINTAIDEANSADVIELSKGTYYESVDYDGKAIRIKSKDPNDSTVVAETIISGNGSGNVVAFDNSETSTSVLEGLTITDGNRGIYCYYSSPTISKCVISGNQTTGDGGGMYNDHSDPNVLSCTFTGNEADDGGGMANYYSDAFVVGCTFTGNDADDDGGGMWN
ncbi:MAG: right-handed parallel beta-helix repeat-containing protein, partial [Planctomycetota bacterium]